MRPVKCHGWPLALALVLFYNQGLKAEENPEVIYGEDNRKEIFELDKPDLAEHVAQATGLILKRSDLPQSSSLPSFKLKTKTFLEEKNLCSNERFSSQPVAGHCTGFLISENLLATAGHCIRNEIQCNNTAIIFNFTKKLYDPETKQVDRDQLFFCKRIVAHDLDNKSLSDFAIIELDRKASLRTPLTLNSDQPLTIEDELLVFGHPSGLPLKVMDGITVRDAQPELTFKINSDTFGGSSGSPVINTVTQQVEGMIIRGERDFKLLGSCNVVYRCQENECRGEDVLRSKSFASYIPDPKDQQKPRKVYHFQLAEGAPIAIPDNDSKGWKKNFFITKNQEIAEISIDIEFKHTFSGDLQFLLLTPSGEAIELVNRISSTEKEVQIKLGYQGRFLKALADLKNQNAKGKWQFIVADLAEQDTGFLIKADIQIATYKTVTSPSRLAAGHL